MVTDRLKRKTIWKADRLAIYIKALKMHEDKYNDHSVNKGLCWLISDLVDNMFGYEFNEIFSPFEPNNPNNNKSLLYYPELSKQFPGDNKKGSWYWNCTNEDRLQYLKNAILELKPDYKFKD